MKNLSGDENCDKTIKKELALAGLFIVDEKGRGEVPYNYIGTMGPWIFKRYYNHWVASVSEEKGGLPLDMAMELHYTKNPIDLNIILGKSIRAEGHKGGLPPNEYGSKPIYNDELYSKLEGLGYKKEYFQGINKYCLSISNEKILELNKEGKLNIPFYVNSYHVDDQIGLNSLVHTIIKHLKKEIWG
jgi:hypothetical protein